jgi:hypothetical protein
VTNINQVDCILSFPLDIDDEENIAFFQWYKHVDFFFIDISICSSASLSIPGYVEKMSLIDFMLDIFKKNILEMFKIFAILWNSSGNFKHLL